MKNMRAFLLRYGPSGEIYSSRENSNDGPTQHDKTKKEALLFSNTSSFLLKSYAIFLLKF
jgi:hypothetical protein